MPANSKVDRIYQAMKKRGVPAGEAAATAQARTGDALSTGKPAKTHGGKPVAKAKGKKS